MIFDTLKEIVTSAIGNIDILIGSVRSERASNDQYFVGIFNSMNGHEVAHDDNSAAVLDFIKFKRVLVIHGNFNIFADLRRTNLMVQLILLEAILRMQFFGYVSCNESLKTQPIIRKIEIGRFLFLYYTR